MPPPLALLHRVSIGPTAAVQPCCYCDSGAKSARRSLKYLPTVDSRTKGIGMPETVIRFLLEHWSSGIQHFVQLSEGKVFLQMGSFSLIACTWFVRVELLWLEAKCCSFSSLLQFWTHRGNKGARGAWYLEPRTWGMTSLNYILSSSRRLGKDLSVTEKIYKVKTCIWTIFYVTCLSMFVGDKVEQ